MAQKIDWGNIDTILLDMDGTLLDLHFDLHFWMEYMPLVFAKKHNITCDEAKDKLYPILRAKYAFYASWLAPKTPIQRDGFVLNVPHLP
jgi:FMN phosphatase YigB (HAD superfamily)